VRRARLRRPTRAGVLRAAPLVVYAGLLVWLIVRLRGVPASRELLVIVVLTGIFAASATSIGRLRKLVVGIAFDWFPFVAMLAVYDLIRGFADGLWLPEHARPQIDLDRAIGMGAIPTVWLQQHLWHGGHHLRWYDYVSWLTYVSYFFVPTLVLAVLWWRSRAEFRRFAWMVVALAFAGCATYVLFPAVPPWMAGQEGLIPPVQHVIAVVSAHTPVVSFQPLWKRGTLYSNNVAAIPSLHAAYTMLIALYLAGRVRSRWRHLLWLYPLLMGFALVYSGEHYVTDVLLGWLYALVIYAIGSRRRLLPRLFRIDVPTAEARSPSTAMPVVGGVRRPTV
jgi:membrane-associated phospholipid phosphatase